MESVTSTTASETQEPQANDLSLAATALFGGGSNEVFIPSMDRKVVIRPATMKHLNVVLDFFRSVMAHMDQEAIMALVEMIADRQTAAIGEGKDPNKVSIEGMSTMALVQKAFANANLLTLLLSAALETLPRTVPSFCDISEAEFGDLPPDEGMLIAGGIFMVNYSFFTRSLPPILTAFMRSWASQNLSTVPQKKAVVKRR